jgi:hypothetical protein
METAKNAGQLFRLFNLVEFGTNQGISIRGIKTRNITDFLLMSLWFGLECGVWRVCEWHIPSSKSRVLQFRTKFGGRWLR